MCNSRTMAFTTKTYLFFILCIITALAFSQARFLSYDDQTMSIEYEKWMSAYGRQYDTEEEKDTRFTIFKGNVEYIESFNSNRSSTYKLGVNAFTDLTKEEFLTKYAGGFVPTTAQKLVTADFRYENITDIPPSLDWRDQGAVTPVKSQGGCGSCWAFSAVAALEGIVYIKSGILTDFSEQYIMDCDDQGDGCNGGRMENAFQLVNTTGSLASETDYPYQMIEGACAGQPSSLPVPITGYEIVPPNNETALLMAVANQPVSVGIDPSMFQFYQTGVFSGPCGTNTSHAVTAVGYGESEDGIKFWLLKNSWGTEFGEDGYFRVQRDSGAPEGMCGVAMDVTFPTA